MNSKQIFADPMFLQNDAFTILTVDGEKQFSLGDLDANPFSDTRFGELSRIDFNPKDLARCLQTEPFEAEVDKDGMLHERYMREDGMIEFISNPNEETLVGARVVKYDNEGEFEFATDVLGIDYYDENGNKTHSRYGAGFPNSGVLDVYDSGGKVQYRVEYSDDSETKRSTYTRYNEDGSKDVVYMGTAGSGYSEHVHLAPDEETP